MFSPHTSQILFVISKPDVFKSPASDTYVIFGEAKIEDMSAQAQSAAAEQFKAPGATDTPAASVTQTEADPKTDEADDDDDDDDQDETGLEPKDIELVMNQAGVSRAKAVKALKSQNSDIVNAIMVSAYVSTVRAEFNLRLDLAQELTM